MKMHTIDKNDKIEVIKNGVQASLFFNNRITSIGQTVFFPGLDLGNEEELFQLNTNNTATKLADLNADTGISTRIMNLTAHQNKLYYVGRGKGPADRELYVTDPGKNTTQKITDSLKTVNLVFSFKDRVYFTAYTPTNGVELYTYDPQIGIYWLLYETAAGSTSSNPKMFLVHKGNLYFTAYNGNQWAMYEFDGAFTPKMLLNSSMNSDFATLADNNELGLKEYNNALHFFYHDSVAKKDAFAKYNFTTQKIDPITFNPGSSNFGWYGMEVYHNKMYISGQNRLWSYDTTNGVMLIDSSFMTNPSNMTVFNDNLYFAAFRDSAIGVELYKYNDTTTSITRVNSSIRNVSAYPNPVRDILHIELNLKERQAIYVTLTDMEGRVVYRSTPTLYNASKSTLDIPTKMLLSGQYVYTIYNEALPVANGKLQKL